MSNDEFVPVFNAKDEYLANIIKSALEDEGIQVVIEPMNKSLAFDGAIALAEGYWGSVLVHNSDLQRATAILDEYSKNEAEPQEG